MAPDVTDKKDILAWRERIQYAKHPVVRIILVHPVSCQREDSRDGLKRFKMKTGPFQENGASDPKAIDAELRQR